LTNYGIDPTVNLPCTQARVLLLSSIGLLYMLFDCFPSRTAWRCKKLVSVIAEACAVLLAASMVLHSNTDAVSTTGRCIKAGDLVIVYERFDSMKSVYVNPGESYGNRYGNFKLKVRGLVPVKKKCFCSS